jgi:AcrR family transcriptional regulator
MVPDGVTRPRVEGEREQEILTAALTVLAEVGYDRLTMDAVATEARASKATLYRRWSSKADLVVEALAAQKATGPTPDTGSLRQDLLDAFCGVGGLTEPHDVSVFTSVLTALSRDTEFAEAFRLRVLAPKSARTREIYDRARDRGELHPDADVELLAPALAGILLHRYYLLGEPPSPATVERVIDRIILPAALA